jgi:hypothetical protein
MLRRPTLWVLGEGAWNQAGASLRFVASAIVQNLIGPCRLAGSSGRPCTALHFGKACNDWSDIPGCPSSAEQRRLR